MAQQITYHKTKKSFFNGFADSLKAPFSAFSFIRQRKGYVKFFIIPFLINIVLLSALVYIAFTELFPYIKTVLPEGSEWYIVILRSVTGSLLFAVTIIATVFLYSITGMIINMLFLDPLSAKVEKDLLTNEPEKLTFRQIISDTLTALTNALKMLMLFLVFNLVIFALNIIPIAGNILFTVLSFLSLLFFFGAPFLELSLDRRAVTFRSKISLLLHYRYCVMGLGLSFMVLSMIPLVGFLSHSLGAVGGSIIFCEKIYPEIDITKK